MITARVPFATAAIEQAHACVVEGCAVLCSPGHVACRRHWCAVPQQQRDPLVQAFQRRLTDPIGYSLAVGDGERLVRQWAHSG